MDPRQVRTDKHIETSLRIKSALLLPEPGCGVPHSLVFFLVQPLLCCCKPLTVFLSSQVVGFDSYHSIFQCFSEGRLELPTIPFLLTSLLLTVSFITDIFFI